MPTYKARPVTTRLGRKPRPFVLIRRNTVSDGARALKNKLNALGIRTILTNKTTFQAKYVVLNWGRPEPGRYGHGSRILNLRMATDVARDKLLTFNRLKELGFANLPDYWTQPPDAQSRGKSIILERSTTTGQSGSGITVRRVGDALGRAPLYVRYVPKEIELRVHVLNGRAIAVQQKRKVGGREQNENEKLIRNHHNGWVFAVNNVDAQGAEAAKPVAVEACRLLGLDFGAVDIIIPKKGGAPIFLEVNTMPGLESDTVLTAYAEEIRNISNEVHNPAYDRVRYPR